MLFLCQISADQMAHNVMRIIENYHWKHLKAIKGFLEPLIILLARQIDLV